MTAVNPWARRLAGRRGWSWRRLFQVKTLVLTLVAAIVIYLALVPLIYLLWGAFVDGDGFTLDAFARAYGDSSLGLGTLVSNTLWFSIFATLVSVVVGTALAYLTERTDVPFRGLIFGISLVPEIVPGILYTIAWIFLGSPRIGLINGWLEPIFGPGAVNVFSMPGMIFVQGFDGVPLVYLLMFAAFRSIDPSLEETAFMSGASLREVVARITIPTVAPAIFGALLITGIRNIESFETPALLGMPGGIWVFTSRIWWALGRLPPDYGQAAAYSISLLLISAVGVYFYSRLSKRGKAFQTVTGKGFRPARMRLGRWRWPIGIAALAYTAVAVVLPVLVLVYLSFQPFYSLPSISSLTNMTTKNYAYIFSQDLTLRSFRNSVLLGIAAATAVMFLGAVTSWMVIRTKVRGRWALDSISFLPLVIPGLVLGVALIFLYLRFPLAIYGTSWILLIAYVTRFMPYGVRYIATSMFQIGSELEESAQTSGASWWEMFRHVTLPLLAPSLIAGWVFVLMISVRELSASILLYSPGHELLSVSIWSLYQAGQLGALSALGMIMISLLVILILAARKLGGRIGIGPGI
jgi:iron(III) transport system permease protein